MRLGDNLLVLIKKNCVYNIGCDLMDKTYKSSWDDKKHKHLKYLINCHTLLQSGESVCILAAEYTSARRFRLNEVIASYLQQRMYNKFWTVRLHDKGRIGCAENMRKISSL